MKLLIVLICFLFIGLAGRAQSFFSRLPKLEPPARQSTFSIAPHATIVTPTDSVYGAFRPVVVAAAYAEPGNLLMAGAGFGYSRLDYYYQSQLYTVKWSVNAVGFAGGSVVPSTPASIMSVGILGGALNNTIMAGPTYNFGTKQFGVALSLGINFNN